MYYYYDIFIKTIITPAGVVKTVCKFQSIHPNLILKKTRVREVVIARMLIAKRMTENGMRVKDIMKLINAANSDVVYYIRQMEDMQELSAIYYKYLVFEERYM